MRTIILATSLLAALAGPAVAQIHIHGSAAPRLAADFSDLAPTTGERSAPGVDLTSPRLAHQRFCVWGSLGDC